ncbi:hypothetical protein QL996_04735 [Planococcus sp. APC 4015]|nr:hypothetical protein [Planococcus sp. APC 4015]
MPHTHSRRSLAAQSLTAGAALGLVTVMGLTATLPLSGAVAASVTSVFGDSVSDEVATPFEAVADDARSRLDDARATLAAASTVRSDITVSGLDLGVDTSIDTAELVEAVDRLADADVIPVLLLPGVTSDTAAKTTAVAQRVATLRAILDGALAEKAAAEAAAQAQREAEAAAAAAAAAQAQANTPDGAMATARQLSQGYGWGESQFSCLVSLWNKESNWNYQAYNPSGATGIPQALPGSKMATAGDDWQTNATTQVAWGLDYIDRAYGSPCAAWGHSQATNWY